MNALFFTYNLDNTQINRKEKKLQINNGRPNSPSRRDGRKATLWLEIPASNKDLDQITQTMLLLEHINLNVDNGDLALRFFLALGAVQNSKSSNFRQVHVNIGLSQFHLPFHVSVANPSPVSKGDAQFWRGYVELVTTEPLDAITKRLLMDSDLAECQVEGMNNESLLVQSPWGCDSKSTFKIIQNKAVADAASAALHAVKGHHGGFGRLIAMTRCVHTCKVGTARLIANFYLHVLDLNPKKVRLFAKDTKVLIQFDITPQTLEFHETERARSDEYNDTENSKYHIAVYLRSEESFRTAFHNVCRANALFVNKKFEGGPIEFASSKTLHEAILTGQFRVKNMFDPDTGIVGHVMEHEIRMMSHVACPLRPREQDQSCL